ncbi:MAG: PilZ domain-containing protein [Candidatus Omnitrophica bacterium]|nr:PilZ domain-containing protein [Candidatus Omnitrophota bacterium]
MKDKRLYKRADFKDPVQFELIPGQDLGGEAPRQFGGLLGGDLSEGGIRFRTEDFIPLNTRLHLNFKVDSDQAVDMTAKVVWVQKAPHAENFQVGMEFVDSSSNFQPKRALKQYLANIGNI